MDLRFTGSMVEAGHELAAFKAHACLMVIAWLACAPLGRILARYYRRTWPEIEILCTDLWLLLRVTFVALTVILTLISFFVVFGSEGLSPLSPDSLAYNAHPVVGLICILFMILQTFMTVFNPAEGSM
jgi:hypothetical protein